MDNKILPENAENLLNQNILLLQEIARLREKLARLENAESQKSNMEDQKEDVTRQKNVEDRLQKSEEQYRALVQHLPNGSVLLFDTDLRYVLTDGAGLASVGLSREMLEGKTIWEALPPFLVKRFEPLYRDALAGKSNVTEEPVRGRIFLARTVPIRNSLGEIFAGMVLSQDITEQKQAQEQLAAEKELLSVTLQGIEDGVITTNIEGNVILTNEAANRYLGCTTQQNTGKSLSSIFQISQGKSKNEIGSLLKEVLNNGVKVTLEQDTVLTANNNTYYLISGSISPLRDIITGQVTGTVLVFRDITTSRRLELELIKLQKLESLGLLAGGIAHDFNNILMAIAGNVSLARLEIESFLKDKEENWRNSSISETSEIFELLREAEVASLRARNLTQQLLTFSKGGDPVKKVTSIDKLAEETARFALRGSRARLKIKASEDMKLVEVDPGQISQVLHNLVLNADQAMPDGGVLSISLENVQSSEMDPSLPLEKGDYVRIVVEDTGIGIMADNLNKIFDPYFTTKQKGSGLGLTTVFGIIKKHGGHIEVTSKLGEGTRFSFYLPVIPAATNLAEGVEHEQSLNKAKEVNPVNQPNSNLNKNRKTRSRILIVDDEAPIREVMTKILARMGYQVEAVADGMTAIEKYKKIMQSEKELESNNRNHYDVVIMDLTIPGGMGGKETIEHLLKINPKVKVIVASGYSEDPVMANYKQYGFYAALTKPFQLNELKQKLNELEIGE